MQLLEGARSERPAQGWAISISTWIHLVLLAVVLYLPLARKPAEPPKQDVVQVDMSQVPKAQVPRKQAAPVPVRPRPLQPPPAQPSPQALLRPPLAIPLPLPPGGSSSLGNETRGGAQSSPPARGEGTSGPPGELPPGPGHGPGSAPTRDLHGALQDFQDWLRSSRTPGGGGHGKGGGGGLPGGLDVPGLPPSGFGFGNLTFEHPDYDWDPYARQIYFSILKAWYRRLYAMCDVFEKWAFSRGDWMLDHQNQIVFTIERSGLVTGVAIETPSGSIPLDDSATDALREVVLPPLPQDFPQATETVHARFIATGDIRNIRSDPQLRAAYYGGP